MVLQDIFDELTYGELSQIAVGGRHNDASVEGFEAGIKEPDYKSIVLHINAALVAVYTRFRLKERTAIINILPEKHLYVLDKRFAITNTESDSVDKYIIDNDDVFDNSLIKIEMIKALREELGLCESAESLFQPLSLNKPHDPYSIHTTSLKTFNTPASFGFEKEPQKLYVDYQSLHPKLDPDEAGYMARETEIELPRTHLQCLLYWIASRITNPSGMVEEFHTGNSYFAKYEAEALKLEMQNVQIDDAVEINHYTRQGFV